MEETKFKQFWNKHGKIIMLFGIRLAEVFASSAIPSTLGVVLIFMNPNKQLWIIMNFIALISFAFANFRCLLKYISGRNNKKEFFLLNGIIYLIYVAASLAAYKGAGYILYSMLFSNLRGLEAFGLKTIHSILICDGIIIVGMAILGIFAYNHTEFIKLIMRMDGADEVEIADENDAVPVQNSREVEMLSVEEMDRAIIEEMQEAEAILRKQSGELSDEQWLENAYKGKNEDIEFVVPENPDNDIDENDYVEANADIINKNSEYSSDSLWENDIYKGKDPVINYEDEVEPELHPQEKPRLRDVLHWFVQYHLRSITRKSTVRRNNKIGDEAFLENDDISILNYNDTTANSNMDYDSDSLWDNNIYQGQNENNAPEYHEDFGDEIEIKSMTGLEDYDGDRLWDTVHRGRMLGADDALAEEEIAAKTGLEDYDHDSLWSNDLVQGRKR